MTLAEKAIDAINFLVDNRQNYNEPTASQVVALLMEIDSGAKGSNTEDGITFTFTDGSEASFGTGDTP